MTITPRSHARARNKNRKAFTLLELVVALVVLGILAALAVPTYLTVIGNAKSAVATSDALSLASDAVAIASTHDIYATDSQFSTAVSEDNGVVSIVGGSYVDGGPGATNTSSITLAVTLGSGVYDVTVSWPDSVNAAPIVTSATVSTSTTTIDVGAMSCSWTLTGLSSPFNYDPLVIVSPNPVAYNSGVTDASISCSNIPSDTGSIWAIQPKDGGYEGIEISDADNGYGYNEVGFSNSSFSFDSNTAALATDDSSPGALADVQIMWFDSLADAEAATYAALTPSNAVADGLNTVLTGASLPACSWTTTGVTSPSNGDTLWNGAMPGVSSPGSYNDGTSDVNTTCTNLPSSSSGVSIVQPADGGYELMTIFSDYNDGDYANPASGFSPASQSWDSNGPAVVTIDTGAVFISTLEWYDSLADLQASQPAIATISPSQAINYDNFVEVAYTPG